MLEALATVRAPFDAWRRCAILTALTALLGLGALTVARRYAGALTAPLPAPQLVALAAVAGTISIGARTLWRLPGDADIARDSFALLSFVRNGGTLAIVLLAVGSTHPPERTAPWLLWLGVLVADRWSAHTYLRRPARAGGSSRTERAEASADEACTVQRIVRTRDAAGDEAIRGTLRADFVTGQRHATLHVGFCPPLVALPEVHAEPTDGPGATVKIVHAFAHGARLEVRLDRAAAAPCHVHIDIAAAASGDTPPS